MYGVPMPVQTRERSAQVATDYTAINVSHAARDDLRVFQAAATGLLRRRVNMTDALRLAVRLATVILATDGEASWSQMQAAEPNGEAQ
jgi:hypothetical protein